MDHFGSVGIYRDLPFFRKKAAAFTVNVAAGSQDAVRVGGQGTGMGAGLFPQAVFFKQACDTAQADNCSAHFIHKTLSIIYNFFE
jgi:hypothetical protein